MIKTKGFKLTIIILLSILTISCFCGFLLSVFYKKETYNKKNLQAADLVISDLNGLQDFATEVRTGNHYEGQTIVLGNDIDCLNQLLPIGTYDPADQIYFSGIFDGQGYTLSNIDIGNNHKYVGIYQGLFIRNDGTIKNTRFKDVYSYVADIEGGAAVIVGDNRGTIENCIVENCAFKSGNSTDDTEVAPFAGDNGGTIKNCMVLGNYSVCGESESDGVKSYFFVANGANADNSVWQANWYETGPTDWWGNLLSPWNNQTDNGNVDNGGGCNFRGCKSMYDHQNIDSTPNRDQCSTSATANTAWYRYSSTDKGFKKTSYKYSHAYDNPQSNYYCVYLRVFIKNWTTYTFNATTGGSVSTGSITVPSEYAGVSWSSSDATVSVTYDWSSCTAYAASGYTFNHWEASGNTFTAYFTKTYKISFASVDHVTIEISSNWAWSGTDFNIGEVLTLTAGTTIELSQTEYDKDGCFKSYTIKIDSFIYPRWIKYTVNDNRYYISGNNKLSTNSSFKLNQDLLNFCPVVKEKTYSVTFG